MVIGKFAVPTYILKNLNFWNIRFKRFNVLKIKSQTFKDLKRFIVLKIIHEWFNLVYKHDMIF